ncbi:PTPA-CTERM sorting domain-containing protein [filamentous cyanobacterium LEGE 11480]|uniref:PTPA-CTERM sorting domain-containing protein n=1 Tax=Romeriopsis navalis LEGE 11480 TaxID=2777977 RepID=A0A928VPF3_9CYAN|nr:PTPA-CTERM sorting domain-containing protein [Romeriopsis navalis]MBE9030205.1 PTPA-CTERM sorting domain-containing protein [Romeriopsis navalis LEGE 11480]
MKTSHILLGATVALSLLAFVDTANALDLTVDARSDIFRPGAGIPTDGVFPPGVNFSPATGQTLTLSSVTGSITCANGPQPNSADGSCVSGATNIQTISDNGIAGVFHNSRTMFLVGLFLADETPTGTPVQADLSGQESQETITTSLAVPFYVGDGLTEDLKPQNFLVPDTATRLFFGFADAFAFSGLPGFYSDNSGELEVDFAIQQTPNSIPTPFMLPSLVGLSVSCLRRKKRRDSELSN